MDRPPSTTSTVSSARLRSDFTRSARAGTLKPRLATMTPEQIRCLARAWTFRARDDQYPPELVAGAPWPTWLIVGGRGAGKTRAGAEWVTGVVGAVRGFADAR